MKNSCRTYHGRLKLAFFVLVSSTVIAESPAAEQMTLQQAIDRAVNRTARGEIIRGTEEVADQNYQAKRINFLVPEISINGSIPAYDVDESYRFFGGASQKQLYRTRDLSWDSFVELKQSLLTGGNLTVTANLTANESRYPDTRTGTDVFIDETRRQGFFNFRLDQPLFRPAATKKDLYDKRDDLEIAKASRRREEASLRQEVIEGYIGVLQYNVKQNLYDDKKEKAARQAEIDSAKFADGVVSEETWLLSSSDRLDSELEQVDIQTKALDERRRLATLLGLDFDDDIQPVEPPPGKHYTETMRQKLLKDWEETTDILKARREYDKARRQAKFASAGHGVTGDLQASYSLGKGNVETESTSGLSDEDINTKGWGVSLKVRIPVWDGGAGGAAVRAAEFESERARLEYEQAVRDARAKISALLNDLDVSFRRLEIMQRQIELAQNRLSIAQTRFDDGQISRIAFLESRIFLLEQKDKYLDELKRYLTNRIELEHRFVNM